MRKKTRKIDERMIQITNKREQITKTLLKYGKNIQKCETKNTTNL